MHFNYVYTKNVQVTDYTTKIVHYYIANNNKFENKNQIISRIWVQEL